MHSENVSTLSTSENCILLIIFLYIILYRIFEFIHSIYTLNYSKFSKNLIKTTIRLVMIVPALNDDDESTYGDAKTAISQYFSRQSGERLVTVSLSFAGEVDNIKEWVWFLHIPNTYKSHKIKVVSTIALWT